MKAKTKYLAYDSGLINDINLINGNYKHIQEYN